MRVPFYLCFLILFLINCKTDCENIGSFSSFERAKKEIKATNFTLEDKCNMNKSSWLKRAEYFSCDQEVGFLIVSTKSGKNYLYANVPKSVWNDFKSADSFGHYYNTVLKGNYQFSLN